MYAESSPRLTRRPFWGLQLPPVDAVHARRVERLWRWPAVVVLAGTIPAFYADLLQADAVPLADLAYLAAALITAVALVHTAKRSGRFAHHLRLNPLDLALIAG